MSDTVFLTMFVVFAAIAIDLAAGDPKSRYHPTAWAGALVACIIAFFAGRGSGTERLGGAIAVVVPSFIVVALLTLYHHYLVVPLAMPAGHTGAEGLLQYAYGMALVASSCILLKCTIAIRGMQEHALAVTGALEGSGGKSLASARLCLSMIVKRSTKTLDREHVISGVIESIGESTSDGITGSLFYYGLFGLPGAFVHRIASTADSVAGYRGMLGRLGWFAARSDTVLNYVPARLTGIMMAAAAAVLRYDWRNSLCVMARDGNSTASVNSGYPMAALAGALGVRLEKEGEYVLCAGGRAPHAADVGRAIRLMKVSVMIFAGGVVVPAAIASSVIAGIVLGGTAGI